MNPKQHKQAISYEGGLMRLKFQMELDEEIVNRLIDKAVQAYHFPVRGAVVGKDRDKAVIHAIEAILADALA